MKVEVQESIRKASQKPLPSSINELVEKSQDYSMYPFHSIGDDQVFKGYSSLADWICSQKTVLIDGYAGTLWNHITAALEKEFKKRNLEVNWVKTADYLQPETDIDRLVDPFLGTPDSVWGTKTTLALKDFFQLETLSAQQPDQTAAINIAIGTGAALLNWEAPVIYFDLPKNEVKYRMRGGSVGNLGKTGLANEEQMYKRFYFVDWVVLNHHKQNIKDQITVIADGQILPEPNWAMFEAIKNGLHKISTSVFRALPWFEAGAWGGQWLKQHISELNQEEVNYAWSFELITPENGLVFESNGNLLEISFDFLMFQENQAVLGKHAEQFKFEFPIRFDFLDTFDGGNLSIQCHPSLRYIQEQFAETITQDETYYILDCKEDAGVYIGFQEDIQPEVFRAELEHSFSSGEAVDIEKYVQKLPAHQHDFFLIPNGTVHSAGTNNLVLEISATPYIFTFKMYDWVRPDLNGNPRPINIEHAFNNLNFERKGEKVREELVSKPKLLSSGADWEIIHLPTHPDHFYDVERLEFSTEIQVTTDERCHVLMLVEGDGLAIETEDGTTAAFHFAETFVVPAAANSYKLINKGKNKAKVVKAFLKNKD